MRLKLPNKKEGVLDKNFFAVAPSLAPDRLVYSELMKDLSNIKSSRDIIDFYSSASEYGPVVSVMLSANILDSGNSLLESIAKRNISKAFEEIAFSESEIPVYKLVHLLSAMPSTRMRIKAAHLINPELYDLDDAKMMLMFEKDLYNRLGAVAPVGVHFKDSPGFLSSIFVKNVDILGHDDPLMEEVVRVLKYLNKGRF